jgi:TM2 domain-containing membrane protein YozV
MHMMPCMVEPFPQTPAGWYPDPSGAPGQRYFDGKEWTDNRAPAAAVGDNLSTKSSAAAGLLQLFFGWFGLGRFYIGSIGIAVTQLVLGLIGIALMFVLLGWIILVPLSIWTFIDAIILFTGNVKDGEGRKLR